MATISLVPSDLVTLPVVLDIPSVSATQPVTPTPEPEPTPTPEGHLDSDREHTVYSPYLIDTNPGNSGAARFKRSYECCKCRLGFREDQVTEFRGKIYGIPCGCSRDIAQLMQRR
jgi:hypothetical protein